MSYVEKSRWDCSCSVIVCVSFAKQDIITCPFKGGTKLNKLQYLSSKNRNFVYQHGAQTLIKLQYRCNRSQENDMLYCNHDICIHHYILLYYLIRMYLKVSTPKIIFLIHLLKLNLAKWARPFHPLSTISNVKAYSHYIYIQFYWWYKSILILLRCLPINFSIKIYW